MTKRRLARKQKKEAPQKRRGIRFWILLFLISTLLFFFAPSHWDGKNSLSLVIAGEDEVRLVIFDPDLSKISILHIPGNTQVTASSQLGTWKLGSIWQLGQQENLKGSLLANTITKSFGVPVDEWAASEAKNLISKNQLNQIKSIFTPFSTSLTIKDKIKLAVFSFQNRSNQFDINLENTTLLQKTRLVSGEEGYLIRSEVPPQILHLFADPKIINEAARIGLVNSTGSKQLALEVSKLIDALGSKIYFIEDSESNDFDCKIVSQKKSYTATRLSHLLGCESSIENTNNLDITISLGEGFARKF